MSQDYDDNLPELDDQEQSDAEYVNLKDLSVGRCSSCRQFIPIYQDKCPICGVGPNEKI